MKFYYITFRSVTFAQRGEKALTSSGIRCTLLRTPRWMEEQGCGYALKLWGTDIAAAVKLLRDNAEQWHIDPNKIAVCGFSAGGHLALASGTVAEHKPNAMILGYPVASAPAMEGLNFMLKLLTGKDAVTEADAEPFELISKITKQSPPAFLVATAEDGLTPYGSLAIANRYSQLGLGYELHVFQYGGHGLARADMTSANGSSRYVDPAFASWLNLSVEWMLKTFGKPEFVDKSNSKMAQYLKDLGVEIPGF